MPKRKRSSPPPAAPILTGSYSKQARYCNRTLTNAQKPLQVALRSAANLERQKHSRRKKYATSKDDTKTLHRINAEYAVLKALSLEQLADQHLRRTIARVKSLKDAELLQEYITGIREGNKDGATLNVTARLFKVAAVKKVVDGVIAELKGILGVGEGAEKADRDQDVKQDGKKKAKSAKVAEKEDEVMQDASEGDDDPYMAFSARIAAPSSGEDDSEASVSGDERPPSIGNSESEHDPDDDLEAESASDAEEEASFDGLSSEGSSGKVNVTRSIAPPSDDSASDSDPDEAAIPVAKTKAKAANPVDTKSGSSAFIPALSHAAYFSGSESDASDLDEQVAPRKNRRGQRARQKIAEAKFGASAKHLEKAQRNAGWDPKRGAVDDSRRARGDKGAKRGKPMGRGPQQSGGNMEPVGERKPKDAGVKRDDNGVLHPSWQAAKAAKESKKLKIDLKGSQAKKVVFD